MGHAVFSAGGLAQVVRAGDSRKFKVDLKGDRDNIIEAASINALAGGVNLSDFHRTRFRGKPCVSYNDYERALVLRSVARHLKRRLRVRTPDRTKAVRGVISSLLDRTPFTVIRCDIAAFYESIPTSILRDNLVFDTASSGLVRGYLSQYFNSHCATPTGLPRGAGLSAILAEIVIRPFDEEVRRIHGVYRYFRYADDIIVFTTGDATATLSKMRKLLPKGMCFNRSKTYPIPFTDGPQRAEEPKRPPKAFEYLGYMFTVDDVSAGKKSRSVSVTISPKKIKRMQTKMLLTFHDYTRNQDSNLLFDRISFIASNYKIRRNGNVYHKGSNKIKSGVYYNYSLCGKYKITGSSELIKSEPNVDNLKMLDGMLRSLINSSRSEFRQVLANQTSVQFRRRLASICFAKGFTSKILVRMTPERIGVLKRAWRNV
ncbi:antiviral reverse transcriptase Drt3a [Novosphingobium soli]|uniref:Antiviral reverse transcriptase Drt3a n=1 Tax=Novosphingobium soli TaxID=574956 RepID=A0ABV6CSF7_9SPHN